MAKPIRRDDPDPVERETAPLTQAMRLAVGLGALPLIGLGLLFRSVGLARPQSAAAEAGETPSPPLDAPRHMSELPSRDEVETALRKLTDATLPKAAPTQTRTTRRRIPQGR